MDWARTFLLPTLTLIQVTSLYEKRQNHMASYRYNTAVLILQPTSADITYVYIREPIYHCKGTLYHERFRDGYGDVA